MLNRYLLMSAAALCLFMSSTADALLKQPANKAMSFKNTVVGKMDSTKSSSTKTGTSGRGTTNTVAQHEAQRSDTDEESKFSNGVHVYLNAKNFVKLNRSSLKTGDKIYIHLPDDTSDAYTETWSNGTRMRVRNCPTPRPGTMAQCGYIYQTNLYSVPVDENIYEPLANDCYSGSANQLLTRTVKEVNGTKQVYLTMNYVEPEADYISCGIAIKAKKGDTTYTKTLQIGELQGIIIEERQVDFDFFDWE